MLGTTLITIFVIILIMTNKELFRLIFLMGFTGIILLAAVVFFFVIPLLFLLQLLSNF